VAYNHTSSTTLDDACVVCIVVVLAPLAAITIDLPFVLWDNNCFVYVAMILFIFL
jgi:hypothetical protein